MNEYEIVDEYGYNAPKVLKNVLDKTLELENVDNGIFTIIFVDEEKSRDERIKRESYIKEK